MKFQIVFLVIFCTFIGVNAEAVKTWIVTTNETINSRFWDSLVIVGGFSFNGSMTQALAIPSKEDGTGEFCELLYLLDTLPNSKDDDSNQTSEGKCADEKVLAKMDRVFWADPRNWKTKPENKATPHAEQIPCSHDSVILPNTTSTFFILPPKRVILESMKFGYMYISLFSWERYAKDEYFMRHFLVKSSMDFVNAFNFSWMGCTERTGCECDTLDYLDEICAFVQDTCAKDLPCEKPLKPVGHCCRICGSTISIWIDEDRFVYKKLVPVVEKFVERQSKELNIKVDWYMSKVSQRELQIVLLPDGEYSEEFHDLVEGLALYMEEEPSNLDISSCWADHAGKPIAKGRGWSATVKIFVGLTIVLIGGVSFVYVRKFKLLENMVPSFKGSKYEQKEDGKNSFYNSKTTRNEVKAQDENTTETGSSTPNEQTNLIDTSG